MCIRDRLNTEIDPAAASRILNDRYVDDFATGGSPLEVARFVGNECEEFQCDGTLPAIMSKGSFRLKAIVISGESNQKKIDKLGGKVLGLGWNPTKDSIHIDFIVSLKSTSKEKVILSQASMDDLDENLLTPRNLLGVVNGIYDPLGLVAPITTRLRVLFRNVFQSESSIDWDATIIDEKSRCLWMELTQVLVKLLFKEVSSQKMLWGTTK